MNFKVKLDSTRISIPLEDCTIISPSLTSQILSQTVVAETGEFVHEQYKIGQPYINDNKETGVYFKIFYDASQFVYVNGKKMSKPFISILINSKLLIQSYFDGITIDTFKQIYDVIMASNQFSCTFESFKNARYNDTDICFDFKSTPKDFELLRANLVRSAVNPDKFHGVNKSTNCGLWTPTKKDPRSNATPSEPFIKFYSKELDMKYNSNDFATAYLKPNQYLNVYRCECTISNSKHKNRLGISDAKTIWQFLNLDLHSLIILMSNEYFTKRTLIKKQGLTPSNYIMLNLINLSIKNGATRTDILNAFNLKQNGVSNKSCVNALEQYQKLMTSTELEKEQLDKNETTIDVMNFLGIGK